MANDDRNFDRGYDRGYDRAYDRDYYRDYYGARGYEFGAPYQWGVNPGAYRPGYQSGGFGPGMGQNYPYYGYGHGGGYGPGFTGGAGGSWGPGYSGPNWEAAQGNFGDERYSGRPSGYQGGYGMNYGPGYGRGGYGPTSYGQSAGYGGYGQYRRPEYDSWGNTYGGNTYGSEYQGQHAGRGPRNYHRSDERIEEDLNEQLTRHSGLDASDIDVQVKSGEVTLSGSVDSRWAKRMAEDIAETCSGVTDVHNQIKVRQQSSASGSSGAQHTGDSERQKTASGRATGTTAAKGS
ncbi:MAG TPA: BON domain-containing protein [Gemmatimonadales bacterium]|nr:BON domain-containing protein [Gemmatimonadales bacterium]